MTKEEAKKWGLILLAYGFGDKCRVEVKESGINSVPLSDLYIVDSGDHGVSEDDYKVMEYKNPLVPDCCIDKKYLWRYIKEEDKFHGKKYVTEKLLLSKSDIFEFAKYLIKQIMNKEGESSEYLGFIRVIPKEEYEWRKREIID